MDNIVKRRAHIENVGLRRAVAATGNLARLAKKLGISMQAIAQWDVIPLSRVREVERITGVPMEQLRSDIFGRRRKVTNVTKNR